MSHSRSKPGTRTSSVEISSLSAIEHILRHRPERIQRIKMIPNHSNARLRQLEQLAKKAQITVTSHNPKHSDPVLATLAPFSYMELKTFRQKLDASSFGLVLVLDHLQDPQNFGAICRTAEGLGIQGIVIPKDRSVAVGPGVYHASVGAVETLPIVRVTNLGEALRQLKDSDFWIVGTTLGEGSTAPWQVPDFNKMALIMGAELKGLSSGLEKLCDCFVQIPLSGQVQSLNVSAAGAILMYEWCRKCYQESS